MSCKLFGYSVFDGSVDNALSIILKFCKDSGFRRVVTLNPEILTRLDRRPQLKEFVGSADLITADGIGIVMACLCRSLKSVPRVTGVDLTYGLLKQEGLSFYLVGSTQESVDAAAQFIRETYPHITVAGCSHGYLSIDQEESVIEDIVKCGPDIVLVGMGFPRQEYFLQSLSNRASKGVGIGVGGVIDMLSGLRPRAPYWVHMLGLEWCFRAIQDPKRFRRWGFIPRFIRKCFS